MNIYRSRNLCEIVVVGGCGQMQAILLGRCQAGKHAVEYVVVPLIAILPIT